MRFAVLAAKDLIGVQIGVVDETHALQCVGRLLEVLRRRC